VIFFHDQGFSVPALRRLLAEIPATDKRAVPGGS